MGLLIAVAIILTAVWGIGTIGTRAFALGDMRQAMRDHEKYPRLYPEAVTVEKVRYYQEARRCAWMWPAMPLLNARASLQEADEMVREHDRKRTEAELKKALRDYELEFDRKLWES